MINSIIEKRASQSLSYKFPQFQTLSTVGQKPTTVFPSWFPGLSPTRPYGATSRRENLGTRLLSSLDGVFMPNLWAERNKQRKEKRKEGRREEEEEVLSSSSPLVRKHQVIKKVFGVFSLEKGLLRLRSTLLENPLQFPFCSRSLDFDTTRQETFIWSLCNTASLQSIF